MIKKLLLFCCGLFVCMPAFADDCRGYKKTPEIKITQPSHNVNISSSDRDLWPKGGYVTVLPFGVFTPNIGYVYNGKYYCVYLDSVDANVGFKDFEIIIDKKYEPGSCKYEAILEHEKHHVSDSERALNDIMPELKTALRDIANSVQPVLVADSQALVNTFDNMQNQIMKNEKLAGLLEKFKARQAADAKVLDDAPDENLKNCKTNKIRTRLKEYFKKKIVPRPKKK